MEVKEFLTFYKDYIAQKDLQDVLSKNKNIDDNVIMKLKNPKTVLTLGIMFGNFGADRFYVKSIFMGILKLLIFLAWTICFMWVAAFVMMPDRLNATEDTISLMFLTHHISLFLWILFWIFDIIYLPKKVKNQNYQMILNDNLK